MAHVGYGGVEALDLSPHTNGASQSWYLMPPNENKKPFPGLTCCTLVEEPPQPPCTGYLPMLQPSELERSRAEASAELSWPKVAAGSLPHALRLSTV